MCDDNRTQDAYLFVFVYARYFVIVGPLSRDLTRHLEVPHPPSSHYTLLQSQGRSSLAATALSSCRGAQPSPGPCLQSPCVTALLLLPRLLTSPSVFVLVHLSLTSRLAAWETATSQAPLRGSNQGSAWGRGCGGDGGAALPCSHGRRQCPPSRGPGRGDYLLSR